MKNRLGASCIVCSAAIAIQRFETANAFGAASTSGRRQHAVSFSVKSSRPSLTPTSTSLSENEATSNPSEFRKGDCVQVEVISFGPLGASVHVVGLGHSPDSLIPETQPPLGNGLVLQKEIHYFRQARNNVDIIKGEVLPAYVEKVRENGNLDISLRTPGGKAKADQVGKLILEQLEWAPSGSLPIGDKSSPQAIGQWFPGVSKQAFKKAVSALYKKGLVQPGRQSIELMSNKPEE